MHKMQSDVLHNSISATNAYKSLLKFFAFNFPNIEKEAYKKKKKKQIHTQNLTLRLYIYIIS